MRPISLKIQGLNSFIEEQKIDFRTLTDKGLFGIFGPTGSGKSTILDAITIALYGEIVRKNKDFINTNCDTLIIKYEFEIGNGAVRKQYIAERNLRRDQHGSIKTRYARLIEKKEDEESILVEKPTELRKRIEEIIGLTLDDFTRSVVLPQGKFSEFLKIKGKDRRDMLERIFALEKYGKKLGDKIKKARNISLKRKSELEGERKGFEDVTEEIYKEKQERLEISKKEEEEIEKKRKKNENDHKKYEKIWNLQIELDEYNKKLSALDERKEDLQIMKKKSKRAEKAWIINPYIEEETKIQKEIKINDEQLKKLEIQLKDLEKKLLNTEKEYKDAFQDKNKRIPALTVKETELKSAIELQKEVQKLEEERTELRSQYASKTKEKGRLEKRFNERDTEEEGYKKRYKINEEQISKTKIDLSYKEKIEKAYYLEKDHKEKVKQIDELNIKLKEKNKSLNQYEEEHNKILKLQEIKHNELKTGLKIQSQLEKSFPGDNDLLLKNQSILNEMKEILKNGREKLKKREEIHKKYSMFKEKRDGLRIEVEQLEKEIKCIEEKKESLEKEIEKIETNQYASIIAATLKEGDSCPVCGSETHKKPVVKIDTTLLKENKREQKKLEVQIKDKNKWLMDKKTTLHTNDNEIKRFDEEIKIFDKELHEIDLEHIEKMYEKKSNEFTLLKEAIEKWNKDKKEVEEKVDKIKEDKSKIDITEGELKTCVSNEKQGTYDIHKELSRVHVEYKNIDEKYIEFKNTFSVEDFEKEIRRIRDCEKEIEKIEKEQKNIREQIEKIGKDKEKLNQDRSALHADIQVVLEVGKEKKEHIEKKEKDINKITEGKNPSTYLLNIENEIKRINDLVDILNKRFEEEKEKKEKISKEIILKSQNKENLKKHLDERKKKIRELIEEYSFESKEEVKKAFIAKEEIERMNRKVKEFEDQLKNTSDNIDRIKKQLNGDQIEEDEWNKIIENKQKYEVTFNEKRRQIITLETELLKIKKDLDKLEEINKKYKKVEHKLSLLKDIDDLTKGNKFVEFVAMNQLKYIAKEASRRLMDITKNRYGLEIDDEGNFTIRDDKNGGVVRETASLSGGETFLTSLSLALALSSQIQLKGSAPLEFFFLDEGFGTLDSDLLEVVMTSLEKLHTDRLAVGIISHVDELKNRVPVKLVVTPSEYGGEGTKIHIEYS